MSMMLNLNCFLCIVDICLYFLTCLYNLATSICAVFVLSYWRISHIGSFSMYHVLIKSNTAIKKQYIYSITMGWCFFTTMNLLTTNSFLLYNNEFLVTISITFSFKQIQNNPNFILIWPFNMLTVLAIIYTIMLSLLLVYVQYCHRSSHQLLLSWEYCHIRTTFRIKIYQV